MASLCQQGGKVWTDSSQEVLVGEDRDLVQGQEGGVRGLAGDRLQVGTEVVKIHLVKLRNKDTLNSNIINHIL